ncbi:hypothetical protein [Thermomonas fusca]|uniref:Lipoprotein n=1 Tax=Thermomonas fusca TaxID=215690 RepID=A0A5R9PFC1_9GAMM|nr:hypothetical protein [Thermomonas fusca]TLX22211.1 hypothetical protein E5S66_06780 [Thermomonas fusca]
MHPYFPVLALALAVALGACSGDRKEATDAAGAAPDAAGAADVVAAVPVGAADVVAEPAAAPVALPEWFPTDVYLPADHVVVEVNEDDGAHAVELRTRGEVLNLAAQAQAAMLAAGWTENHYSPVDTRGGASMYYRKGDRSATLAMAWAGDGQVRLMYNFATVRTKGDGGN